MLSFVFFLKNGKGLAFAELFGGETGGVSLETNKQACNVVRCVGYHKKPERKTAKIPNEMPQKHRTAWDFERNNVFLHSKQY